MPDDPGVPPGFPSASDLEAARGEEARKQEAVREEKRALARTAVRKERVADLARGIGELWATFGVLDGLMEAQLRKACVPAWWWVMVVVVGSVLMIMGTLGAAESVADRHLHEERA